MSTIELTKEQTAKIEATAVMDFVTHLAGALDSGFVDTPHLTIGELYQVATNHVRDSYNHTPPTLAELFDVEFADYANGKQ